MYSTNTDEIDSGTAVTERLGRSSNNFEIN